MDLAHILILAIVEGITEFLPISSTAHLILTSKLLGLTQSPLVSLFEVVIQSGAILAVIVLYWSTLMSFAQQKSRLFVLLGVSFAPTALAGLLFHDVIKNVFFHAEALIALSLIGVGALFIVIEKRIQSKKISLTLSMHSLTLSHAVLIGCAQALAIVPGVSRAGAVMFGMMVLGYKRTDAALYSFLLAIPTLLAAGGYDLLKADPSLATPEVAKALALGGIVACFSAYICVKWLIGYLQKNTLTPFGYYRIALGALLLASMALS